MKAYITVFGEIQNITTVFYLVLNTFRNILGQQNNLLYNIFIIVQKIKKVKTYFIITYFIKSKAISIKLIKMCSK